MRSLMLRTLAGLLATCLLGLLLWALLRATAGPAATAAGLAGQHWYRLALGDSAIGYYLAETRRSWLGHFSFATELRFALSVDEPVRVRDLYRFAAAPPHQLITAQHRLKRSDTDFRIDALLSGSRLEATVHRNGDASSRSLDVAYALTDYLAVERWLEQAAPRPGDRVQTRSLNLAKLQVDRDVYELVERRREQIVLRNPAMVEATEISLGRNFVPRKFQLAGVFDLTLVPDQSALSPPEPLAAASFRATLDRALDRPRALTRLTLAVISDRDLGLPSTLALTANPLLPSADGDYLAPTLEYPSDHQAILELLDHIDLPVSPAEQVPRLVEFVHNYLRYDPSFEALPVLDVVRERRGDCTEFADLLTSLARAAGIPSRTVVGMAYTDEGGPALAFHAWNQLYFDNRWTTVDPTWNQQPVDATHWPLPSSDRTALLLLTGQAELSFEVLATEYQR